MELCVVLLLMLYFDWVLKGECQNVQKSRKQVKYGKIWQITCRHSNLKCEYRQLHVQHTFM